MYNRNRITPLLRTSLSITLQVTAVLTSEMENSVIDIADGDAG
ncbi:hypothetical protein O9993_00765 [Vibrio lentus]|nr:hypothetical protein [Vibrio lentus]